MSSFEQGKSFEECLAEWRPFAVRLADWAMRTMLNRNDGYVRYLPIGRRTASRKALTEKVKVRWKQVRQHFSGGDVGKLLAFHSISKADTCRWIAVDVDCHEDDPDLGQRNWNFVVGVIHRVAAYGFSPLVMDSDSRGGIHLILFFQEPVPSETAYRFAKWLVQDWKAYGISEPESFPKQLWLKGQGFGNALRLPGRHHTRPHVTRVFNPLGWHAGGDAAQWILDTPLHSPQLIPEEARNYLTPEERDRQLLQQMSACLPKPKVTHSRALSSYDAQQRARRYLDRSGPSIEGQRGDNHFWRLACSIRAKIPLTVDEAYPLFLEWNAGCVPPFDPEFIWKQLLRVWSKAA